MDDGKEGGRSIYLTEVHQMLNNNTVIILATVVATFRYSSLPTAQPVLSHD
jgi:hypothetical protein